MNETESQIFSSTGSLGTSERQDGRLYHNAEVFYEEPAALADIYRQLGQQAADIPSISRVVCRAVVSHNTLDDLINSELGSQLEVALSLDEYGHDGWLVYLSQNAAHRLPLVEVSEMVERTSGRLEVTGDREGVLLSTISDDLVTPLHGLWSETFGWSMDEIQSLQRRLQTQEDLSPEQRSVWFRGLTLEDHGLASAAMAERIDLPGPTGEVTLIESTEWRSLSRGLMPTVLRSLNRQLAVDSSGYSQLPIVYAECNYTSRSDKAGQRAGFKIPPRDRAPQILVQNVTVNDGMLASGVRDFTFMHLPAINLEALR